jgi:hypothetical protein
MQGLILLMLSRISFAASNGRYLERPPYSPDISPCNYDVFAKMKDPLWGTRNIREDIIRAVGRSLLDINKSGCPEDVQCHPKYDRWWYTWGGILVKLCLPQLIKSFQNYSGVATTLYSTLVYSFLSQQCAYDYRGAGFSMFKHTLQFFKWFLLMRQPAWWCVTFLSFLFLKRAFNVPNTPTNLVTSKLINCRLDMNILLLFETYSKPAWPYRSLQRETKATYTQRYEILLEVLKETHKGWN